MNILDGKKIRDELSVSLKKRFNGCDKTLAIIIVGNREDSKRYVKHKIIWADKIGIKTKMILCSDVISEEKLISTIENLNNDESVGGIILQLPLPESLDKQKVLNSISLDKDIDALSDSAWKKIESGEDCIYPATATGIITMLDYYNIPLKDKKIAVIGKSKLVGKPTAILLEKRGAIVSVCHLKTTNTKEITKSSDIIISAAGVEKLITKENVSPGQIIIDVGINKGLVGDVEYEEVSKIVDYITPVPGGVGPMTIISIFENFAKLVGK
jgi:methylenetetrahydrofolate dehydrogenase (NADP+)/methenyltetrahydrofolate cyclohydrolase